MEDGVLIGLLSVTPQPAQLNSENNCSPLKTTSLCDSGYFLHNLMKSQCACKSVDGGDSEALALVKEDADTGWAEPGCSQVDWKQIEQNNKYPDAQLLLHYSFGSLLFCIAQNRRKKNILFLCPTGRCFLITNFLIFTLWLTLEC